MVEFDNPAPAAVAVDRYAEILGAQKACGEESIIVRSGLIRHLKDVHGVSLSHSISISFIVLVERLFAPRPDVCIRFSLLDMALPIAKSGMILFERSK
jgi:hypothetical protein